MFKPAGYDSYESGEDSDGYDMYFGGSEDKPKRKEEKVLTVAEKYEIKLHQLSQYAFSKKTAEVLNYLDEGIEVDVEFKDNWTLLMIAASMGNHELALELIKRGANVNQSRDQYTVLMAACACPVTTSSYENSYKIVEELVRKKADVDAKSRKRKTALMFAASSGNFYAVELLLPICKIYEEDNQGWSALFWAVNDKHPEILSLLIENGLNCDKYDVRRLKPLDYAKQGDDQDILRLLPDPDRDKSEIYFDSHYKFNEEMKRKKFQRDVFVMLTGMNCDNLVKKFSELNIDLYRFLTLTRKDLINFEITKPYQQNRILGGIYRYHRHPYKFKSIPTVSRENTYTTIDVARSLIAALRHIIIMQAAIKYLYLNMIFDNENELLGHIGVIEDKIVALENTLQSLRKRTIQWDKENTSVDLITDKWTSSRYKWVKYLSVASASIFTFVYIKIKYSN